MGKGQSYFMCILWSECCITNIFAYQLYGWLYGRHLRAPHITIFYNQAYGWKQQAPFSQFRIIEMHTRVAARMGVIPHAYRILLTFQSIDTLQPMIFDLLVAVYWFHSIAQFQWGYSSSVKLLCANKNMHSKMLNATTSDCTDKRRISLKQWQLYLFLTPLWFMATIFRSRSKIINGNRSVYWHQ